MDGVLLFDKPKGWTSHDLVDAVRRHLAEKKVGHAGTLDPLATGLMILLIGKATRSAERFSGMDKGYGGSFRLGVNTDTWDLEGRVLSELSTSSITAPQVEAVFGTLTGDQALLPPAFSAVKKNGQRAYALARKGVAVEMSPRPMTIASFILERFAPPEVFFHVECSKGTYVRSLANETGLRLGCGATLSSLVRTRIGPYALKDAWAFDAFKSAPKDTVISRLGAYDLSRV